MELERYVVKPVNLDNDYQHLMKFWCQKGLPEVPRHFLPNTGYVVWFNLTIVCGGFLTHTDTNQASIAFISANPEMDKKRRGECLDILIEKLGEEAKMWGFEILCAATNVPALQDRYKRLGMMPTDENVTCFAGRL